MVTRNFSVPEVRLLQVADDDSNFVTLEELKPVIDQQNIEQYNQSNCYELPNSSQNTGNSDIMPEGYEHLKPVMDSQPSGNSATFSKRKRKLSYQDTSDPDDDSIQDDKPDKVNDENKKQNHSEIEKRRRDKMNTYITELSAMIPMCQAMSRKLDKLTVLRMAVQHLKTIRGPVHPYSEGHYKPSFLSDQELKHLILQAADGFLFVVGCDRGRIMFVSESVSSVLNFSQGELLGQSLFDVLHPKDVSTVKEQLSASDLSPRERLIDAKTMLPVKTDVRQEGSRLYPGARRSFFCRMKSKMSSQVKEEADTTTGCHRKKKQDLDKKYNLIHCTGYLKSWTPMKMGINYQETDADNELCNLSCLVAVGRILPHLSQMSSITQGTSHALSIQFISRHTLDGKFLLVDQRATFILGFLQQELVGSSMYEYYHRDDITSLAECHKCVLQNCAPVTTKVYRFKTRDGGFVRLQSEWKSFRSPWTKDAEYLLAKNKLIQTDIRTVESSECKTDPMSENVEIFSQCPKNMQKLINTHVEASKIGRQIAEQVMDSQRRSADCSPGLSPKSHSESSTPISSTEVSLPSSGQPSGAESITLSHDFLKSKDVTQDKKNIPQSSVTNDAEAKTDDCIIEIMEDGVRRTPSNEATTEGNDEAAMAVIMSLLEADAGLGGPVDFSGLPWPLP